MLQKRSVSKSLLPSYSPLTDIKANPTVNNVLD